MLGAQWTMDYNNNSQWTKITMHKQTIIIHNDNNEQCIEWITITMHNDNNNNEQWSMINDNNDNEKW